MSTPHDAPEPSTLPERSATPECIMYRSARARAAPAAARGAGKVEGAARGGGEGEAAWWVSQIRRRGGCHIREECVPFLGWVCAIFGMNCLAHSG
eukprot:940258-Prymnesium_polylepis.1